MDILKKIPLFQDIASDDLSALLTCLSVQEKNYVKDVFLIQAGDQTRRIGVVMSGTAQ